LTPKRRFNYMTFRIVIPMDTVAPTPVVLLGDPPLPPRPRAVRSVGRPRDPRVDAAVLEATRALLIEVGYEQLTIEAIARRAGVHRPAVYRRWSSKAELVHDAVYPAGDTTLRLPDSGDFVRDLRALVRNAIAIFSRPEVRAAVPGLMAAMRTDPELGRSLAPRLEAGARREFSRWLAAAVRRRAARPLIDADTVLDLLAGTILFRLRNPSPTAAVGLEDDLVTLLRQMLIGPRRPVRARR
jgi:AcrR family transcriptional regulator